ncbi:unnamed protein product [Schistocephalus solidus]|uniref:Uncharacterized protein n=1 Tax=Schistocephalus solidus TaxID=70667 RepID=A0A183SB01_SCHSO|nr:unnamed protein product [Schistocephalus solidus]
MKFWARYVDYTFVIIKRSEVQAFETLFNSIFLDIQFTMEEEVNNQLPFLDEQGTKLIDGKIRTMIYRKATNTMRILHFRSNYPIILDFHDYMRVSMRSFIDKNLADDTYGLTSPDGELLLYKYVSSVCFSSTLCLLTH